MSLRYNSSCLSTQYSQANYSTANFGSPQGRTVSDPARRPFELTRSRAFASVTGGWPVQPSASQSTGHQPHFHGRAVGKDNYVTIILGMLFMPSG